MPTENLETTMRVYRCEARGTKASCIIVLYKFSVLENFFAYKTSRYVKFTTDQQKCRKSTKPKFGCLNRKTLVGK